MERILRKQLGKTGVNTILSKGVYLIWIGTNDYTVYASDSKLFSSYSLEKYVDMVIGNLSSVIEVSKWIPFMLRFRFPFVPSNTQLLVQH